MIIVVDDELVCLIGYFCYLVNVEVFDDGIKCSGDCW